MSLLPELGPPRRFDPTAQTPHSSDQTIELNSCINPNSNIKVSFSKDVRGDRGSKYHFTGMPWYSKPKILRKG